jgi:hypothetical protein
MGAIPDISAVVTSLESSLMANQAVQSADLAARLGASTFRLQVERKQDQVTETSESADTAEVSAQGHQAQAFPSASSKSRVSSKDQGRPVIGGRIGTRIDLVV